jgi:hypothetical protein
MLKTLALVGAGLMAGFAVAMWFAPGSSTSAGDIVEANVAPLADRGASAARLASLEDALAAETARRAELEQRVGDLAAALDELRTAATAAPERAVSPTSAEAAPGEVPPRARGRREGPPSAEEIQRRQVDLLVAAGFPPDRAEWISRRTQELRMESLQAQYNATREGRPPDASTGFASERKLRAELGDADYERYLTALNRPTNVNVMTVLASSPAERVGLKPGDQIVSYAGARVFDVRELNALTFEGRAGESVVVEVRRDGQPLQLVLPRGPLGITGGFTGQGGARVEFGQN